MNARILFLAVTIALVPIVHAHAQDSGLAASCSELPGSVQGRCSTVAQAAASLQPQLGILIAGGNPTLGTASTGGIRLGLLPRVSATARVNAVFVRVPDVIAEAGGTAARQLNETVGIPAPALGGNLSVGVFPGLSLAPTVGGVGAVDLLASASWLPLAALGKGGFEEDAAGFAYGAGARIGLLRESFVTPGISVSVMYRRLGETAFGDVCRGDEVSTGSRTSACTSGGDLGELRFDLSNWSTRAAISKRLLGLGLTAGVGHDRFSSDVRYALRADDPTSPTVDRIFRSDEIDVDAGRWSVFGNGSYTILFGTIAAEAGWMEGADPIAGFDEASSGFDPRRRTWFGSLGFRLSL